MRALKYRNSIAVIILFFVNLSWFVKFKFQTIMGDDLFSLHAIQSGQESLLHYTLFSAPFGKYRPVFNFFQYVTAKIFGTDLQLYIFFNIIVNFIAVVLMFCLLLLLTRKTLYAFIFALIFVTCRFSYYNVLQIYGLMEAVALILFLLMLLFCVYIYQNPKRINLYALLLLQTLLIFTHERYIVTVPFLFLLLMYIYKKKKWYYALWTITPVLLNVALKKIVIDITFLQGTGGAAIGFDFLQIVIFVGCGLLNMVGINVGAPYLNGINFPQESLMTQTLSVLISGIYLVLLIALIRQFLKSKLEHNKSFVIFGLGMVLMLSLLLAASITIRQEYRWLYAPYAVLLLLTAYVLPRLQLKNVVKYILLLLICIPVFKNDLYVRKFLDRVYFMDALHIADSTYASSIKQYGLNIRFKTIYIQNDPALIWTLQGSTFFQVYAENPSLKVTYVDDLSAVDLAQTDLLLLKFNTTTRLMEDVTDFYIGSKHSTPVTIRPEDWAIPDSAYAQITASGEKLFYKIVTNFDKMKDISLVDQDRNVTYSLSDTAVNNESLSKLEPGKFAFYRIDNQMCLLWISIPNNLKMGKTILQ
ncbi:hypothetical protein B5M42_011845 [Paenibacillus athensensis]|uniref:Glycosyltransferase RgtA/B/C/D-like domain-containing protein n=1 Tax=Paenibacillus athensensis TaxID=1967502 RepID=A0A4Y8Q7I3_9BACL|nr:hypothetical protein [Paenibacillus athensensis]MCD1259523.1 hypothetical protein [Paenibacillus athensensis]